MRDLPRPGNGHDEIPLVENPGKRELCSRHALTCRHFLQQFHERGVGGHVLGAEARKRSPEILGAEIVRFLDLTCQEAASQWAEWHEADTKFAAGVEDFAFRIAGPERVFALQSGNRMDSMSLADGGGSRFRKAERAHLALLHKVRHRADGLL